MGLTNDNNNNDNGDDGSAFSAMNLLFSPTPVILPAQQLGCFSVVDQLGFFLKKQAFSTSLSLCTPTSMTLDESDCTFRQAGYSLHTLTVFVVVPGYFPTSSSVALTGGVSLFPSAVTLCATYLSTRAQVTRLCADYDLDDSFSGFSRSASTVDTFFPLGSTVFHKCFTPHPVFLDHDYAASLNDKFRGLRVEFRKAPSFFHARSGLMHHLLLVRYLVCQVFPVLYGLFSELQFRVLHLIFLSGASVPGKILLLPSYLQK